MHHETQSSQSAEGLRIGLVVSRYHHSITDALRSGAQTAFETAGGRPKDLLEVVVPGAFELTAVARALAFEGGVDAVVTIGCIITGETTHDQYIAHAVAQGLTQITAMTGIPVAFGVLTCQNLAQAEARAGGAVGNTGQEAMTAMIETIHAIRSSVGEVTH